MSMLFWVVRLCGLVTRHQRFGGTCCFHLQGSSCLISCVGPSCWPGLSPHSSAVANFHSLVIFLILYKISNSKTTSFQLRRWRQYVPLKRWYLLQVHKPLQPRRINNDTLTTRALFMSICKAELQSTLYHRTTKCWCGVSHFIILDPLPLIT
jgi:hypothetical protein